MFILQGSSPVQTAKIPAKAGISVKAEKIKMLCCPRKRRVCSRTNPADCRQ